MVDSRDELPQPGQEDALTHCKEKDVDDCWFYYTYSVNSNSEVHVHVVKDPGNVGLAESPAFPYKVIS